MLNALYNYSIKRGLSSPPGYVNKVIKGYICLSSRDRGFVDILRSEEEIPCPDIGTLANGTEKSNVLAEKRSVVLPDEKPTKKNLFFLDAMKSLGEIEPKIQTCVESIEDPDILQVIKTALGKEGIKATEVISFMVDGIPIVKFPKVEEWWAEYRKQFLSSNSGTKSLCLITGNSTVPMRTTTPIRGLKSVGGHARGDALIGFDKNAFQSYDLKQAWNAPVSEEAFSYVKLAIEELLKKAPVLAGVKYVHWFSDELPSDEDDELADLLGNPAIEAEDDENDSGSEEISYTDEKYDDEYDKIEQLQYEEEVRQLGDELVESVKNGKRVNLPANLRYYILMLSGVNGRIMIRKYEQGSYKELQQNLKKWQDDLQLTNENGTGLIRSAKLKARLIRLIGYKKNRKDIFKQMDDELSSITTMVVHAIVSGTKLPDAVALRALRYIRSQRMAKSDEASTTQIPDRLACQWLKVWVIRNSEENNTEGQLLEIYNMNSNNVAYHCGGMVALYAEIQHTALKGVKAGIIERYYASACQTPALVIGHLSKLSNYHLNKIENANIASRYRNKLAEIASAIQCDSLPETLDLKQQAEFTLGYYQMCAKLAAEKKAFYAKQNSNASLSNQDNYSTVVDNENDMQEEDL